MFLESNWNGGSIISSRWRDRFSGMEGAAWKEPRHMEGDTWKGPGHMEGQGMEGGHGMEGAMVHKNSTRIGPPQE
jgi:hypothetical protein